MLIHGFLCSVSIKLHGTLSPQTMGIRVTPVCVPGSWSIIFGSKINYLIFPLGWKSYFCVDITHKIETFTREKGSYIFSVFLSKDSTGASQRLLEAGRPWLCWFFQSPILPPFWLLGCFIPQLQALLFVFHSVLDFVILTLISISHL